LGGLKSRKYGSGREGRKVRSIFARKGRKLVPEDPIKFSQTIFERMGGT